MSIPLAVFLFGGLLLTIGIIGGGFEIREIKVPRVGSVSRFMAAVAGLAFIGLGIFIGVGTGEVVNGGSPVANANQAQVAPPVAVAPTLVAPTLVAPNVAPTVAPTRVPTRVPTLAPTRAPTRVPTATVVPILELRIDAGTAYSQVQHGQAVLVDVRSRNEYLAAHARGAIWLQLAEVERSPVAAIAALPRDKRPIFCCT